MIRQGYLLLEGHQTLLQEVLHNSGDCEVTAMGGDTNLFLQTKNLTCSAEAEITIAEAEVRGRGMGWEAMVLMLR